MNKKHLSACNKSLLLAMPAAVSSGILLECLHGAPFASIHYAAWVWLHVGTSLLLTMLVVWHIRLHGETARAWRTHFMRHWSKLFRGLVLCFLLAGLTGLLALPQWLLHGHGGIGGLHGKTGFVCAGFMLMHLKQHKAWYKRNSFFA